ncbi:MAG: heat-shock protein Hsp20 [Bacteroidetes bacterium]|jgi:HSP20 family protein|nr:heat-shock protein Hsp20 [Bacteroidota bacterium]
MLMRINQFPILSPSWQSVLDLESVFGAIPSQAYASRASRLPLMNLAEGENESVLTVELPGVNKEDVKISLEGGLLTVTGERKAQGIPEGARWLRSESINGKFVRTLELPHPVDPKTITAELKNGILSVVLPKAEEARPREITIR